VPPARPTLSGALAMLRANCVAGISIMEHLMEK